jgi:hypothetical protein
MRTSIQLSAAALAATLIAGVAFAQAPGSGSAPSGTPGRRALGHEVEVRPGHAAWDVHQARDNDVPGESLGVAFNITRAFSR